MRTQYPDIYWVYAEKKTRMPNVMIDSPPIPTIPTTPMPTNTIFF